MPNCFPIFIRNFTQTPINKRFYRHYPQSQRDHIYNERAPPRMGDGADK